MDCLISTALGNNVTHVRCNTTGFEDLWSTRESGTYKAMVEAHVDAHDRARFAAAHRHAVRTARRIYRTTEPGDRARRGIGAYL